jgi:6-phosphofructo-2-kinase/fructose-2,6-biphosphatase 2
VILELERHREEETSIYIVAHQAVVRCLYAYFHGISHEELPYIKIPLHTIIKLEPKAYLCKEERYVVDVPAVDTYRPKTSKVKDVEK